MESSGYLYDTGNSGQGIAMFYAESWLIVHYLHSRPERRQQLREYLEAFDHGADPGDAFESIFKMTGLELQKEITDYIWSKKLPYVRYDLSDARYQPNLEIRRLSAMETKLIKATAQVHFGTRQGNRRGRSNLKDLLKANPQSADALTIQAEYLLKDNKVDRAEEALKVALATDPENASAQALLSLAYLTEAQKTKASDDRNRLLELSRLMSKAAIESNPEIALAHYDYATSYLIDQAAPPEAALVSMETAYKIRPQLDTYLYDYGLLLLKSGQEELAESAFRRVSNWASSHNTAYRAANIVEDIEKGRVKPISAYLH